MKMNNDTYLSDWLADKITDGQLKELVSQEDFIAFQKIKNALDTTQIEHPDLERNFSAIKQKMAAGKTIKPVKTISLRQYVTIAACLVLCLGVYHFLIDTNHVATGFGDTSQIVLRDDSKVFLNSKSELCYSNYFQYKRTLQLEGEAYFEVQKGSPFIVETPLGNIRVLGTKFNVIAFGDFFEVVCYEGKVQVTKDKKATILTPGESIRFYDGIIENWAQATNQKPSWISGESSFSNVPMQYVIDQFKNQYNIAVSYPAAIEKVKFTGTFTHTNLNVALQTICIPLHLKYTKTGSGKILISK
jgi:transmembrane sensor